MRGFERNLNVKTGLITAALAAIAVGALSTPVTTVTTADAATPPAATSPAGSVAWQGAPADSVAWQGVSVPPCPSPGSDPPVGNRTRPPHDPEPSRREERNRVTMAVATLALTHAPRLAPDGGPRAPRESIFSRRSRAMGQHIPAPPTPPDPAAEVRCVEAVFRTSHAASRPQAPITAARLLSLLPATWQSDLRVAVGEIAILVARTEGLTAEERATRGGRRTGRPRSASLAARRVPRRHLHPAVTRTRWGAAGKPPPGGAPPAFAVPAPAWPCSGGGGTRGRVRMGWARRRAVAVRRDTKTPTSRTGLVPKALTAGPARALPMGYMSTDPATS